MTNSWAAYQVDNAVTFVGVTIDNAKEERVNRGDAKRPDYRPKYTLEQLLAPNFRLPNPAQALLGMPSAQGDSMATILALAGQPRSGVKKWAYQAPEPEQSQ